MKKVAFYTLGCKLNYSETSAMGRLMAEHGFETVQFHEQPDVYVINTCSVTDNADKKCRKVIKEALRYSPNARIVIVGCYAQLKPAEIAGIPGVDLVLGAAEKFNLAQHLQELPPNEKGRFVAGNIQSVNFFVNAYSAGERTRSFLKVQDGCDYKCSFCTIPLARGSSRSNTIENVLENAREIVALGVKEIVLTGVNIGDYGKQMPDGETDITFYHLLQALDEIPVPRIRISSIEPNLLTNEIIAFVARSKRFMPHFHIPLQSGNNRILRLMRRRYVRELYEERVETIKQLIPHCCIGVDVITGFPSETDEEFTDTYNFLNRLNVSYLHVFTYSERANTHALSIQPAVPLPVRQERSRMLHILSDKKRRFFYEQHLQTIRPVLFEAETDGITMNGFTDNYIKIAAPYNPLLVNEIEPALLHRLTPDNLMEIELLLQHQHHTTAGSLLQ
ncbi:tRNA (N(6)-L-threonylcarbamoyladenosine(37)-C(2))-methylthiotransferase MtaB [Sphingobacteriales bacterium UPWRP_1]|nr:tRNA (N(6)-L-threonylcarbamoyladenosine(37)-C(2))-methylthiotransferase MtaB [Sphingobacteriales bacterium TSM_CSM]PSJ72450.1 tRNA (N(6)-L-threonylcarbamoyladenosine(37)-C(2))-methylthiotransferase MtaB [Sphingobacteriales bacterium UPWRP_1]